MPARFTSLALAMLAALAVALLPEDLHAGYRFQSMDGGEIDIAAFSGRPVLVVNTASLCGFAGQFDDLQDLHETYGDKGLVVLAVPSNDFRQELKDAAAVKEYCTLNFDLTIPMTDITHVKGADAHPFYAWMRDTHGFEPGWNFNKVLIGPDGQPVATWGAATKPTSRAITGKIEALLP